MLILSAARSCRKLNTVNSPGIARPLACERTAPYPRIHSQVSFLQELPATRPHAPPIACDGHLYAEKALAGTLQASGTLGHVNSLRFVSTCTFAGALHACAVVIPPLPSMCHVDDMPLLEKKKFASKLRTSCSQLARTVVVATCMLFAHALVPCAHISLCGLITCMSRLMGVGVVQLDVESTADSTIVAATGGRAGYGRVIA